jgi:hypothetical protein
MSKTLKEFLEENPSKGINDYFIIYGKDKTKIENEASTVITKTANEVLDVSSYMAVTSIKISMFRLFLYTGIVILSSMFWVILIGIITIKVIIALHFDSWKQLLW